MSDQSAGGDQRENDVAIPTEDEIKLLPRWARVAFAARCARRVQPLFAWARSNVEQNVAEEIEFAITLAEWSAANANLADYTCTVLHSVSGFAAEEIYWASIQAATSASRGVGSADSAAIAASSARNAYLEFRDWFPVWPSGAEHRAGFAEDFELLKAGSRIAEWNDDTPVPPEFFGPLWPRGVPDGWPVKEEASEGNELVLELEIPDGVSDEEMYAKAIALADDADSLHRAYGGNGLKVKTVEVYDELHVREGVPS